MANPKVLAALEESETVVYSIGSLYTSIIPSLILRGVGAAIKRGRARNKVLILNAKVDRETGPARDAMTAVDFVRAIAKALKESQTDFGPVGDREVGMYVSHLVYLAEDETAGVVMPRVDGEALGLLGIRCVKVKGKAVGEGRQTMVRYDEDELVVALEGIIQEGSNGYLAP